MNFIDRWQIQLLRFWSTYGIAAMTAWGMTPEASQQALLQWAFGSAVGQPYVMPLLAFVTLYLRLLKQPAPEAA